MATALLLASFEFALKVINVLNLTICILNPWILLPFRPVFAQRIPKRWSVTMLPVVSYALLEPLAIWGISAWSMPPFAVLLTLIPGPCIPYAIGLALPSEDAQRKNHANQIASMSTGEDASKAAVVKKVCQYTKVVKTLAALCSVSGAAATNATILLLGPSLQDISEDARPTIAGLAAFALSLILGCRVDFGEYKFWTWQAEAFVDGSANLTTTVIINFLILQVVRGLTFYTLGLDGSIILRSIGIYR
ncbi:hypothetical protein Tdes44962_MAKER04490 [Teratosphaeria destructans]|uniref:Uncharacterized protein n=1 Tax=Teratosphaeria destructans TaxID=418781 RepID=A0A9W7SM67_9PEZI|nr:hypothetical protein Tdes44962_MAKER04490 [Teratosphaeria destructans]